MTRDELRSAIREAASAEFRDIPTDDALIDYTFSPSFEATMKDLIRKEKRSWWRMTNTARKRVCIIAAALIMLFATACSIPSVLKPIVNFFSEVYETFAHYFFEGEKTNTIKTEYVLTKLPDGYVEVSREELDAAIFITYENSDGHSIKFSQKITDDADLYVDLEKGTTIEITLNDNSIMHLYEQDNFIRATFVKGTYYIVIIHQGDLTQQEITEIVNSISLIS
ncbi:MAG: DUF4367 domain-containing protein [Clostridia bacterium]|nr:DUF4367 domain-containing protein [Clostridia bacterium]